MPDPNNNEEVNQNTDPVDISKEDYAEPKPQVKETFNVGGKEVEIDITDLADDISQGKTTAMRGVSNIKGSNKSMEQMIAEESMLKQKLEQGAVVEEAESLFENTMRFTASLAANTAAMLWDTVGALDVGDMRVPEMMGVGTVMNEVFKFVDNTIGDGEEKSGNWATRTAAKLRMKNQYYNTLKTGNSYMDYFLNTGAAVVGSVGGAMLGAASIGRATGGLGAGKALQTLTNAIVMTNATAFSIAEDVQKKVYSDMIVKLAPEVKEQQEAAYQQAYEAAIEAGSSLEDASYKAQEASDLALMEFGSQNPDFHKQASEAASKGAEVAIQTAMPSFLLNITGSGLFSRGHKITREALKAPTRVGIRETVEETLQEGLEEGIIETFAQDMGEKYGMKGSYSFDDATKALFSKQTLESMLIGGISGGLMGAGGSLYAYSDKKKKYDEQQKAISEWNKIGDAIGKPELLDNLTSVHMSSEQIKNLAKEQERLAKAGKEEEAKQIGDRILGVQAYNAFKTKTTKELIENFEKVAQDESFTPEVRERMQEGISQIKEMEKTYQQITKKNYRNAGDIFSNRVSDSSLNKLKRELESEIIQKKVKASEVIDNALKQGGLSLKSSKANIVDSDEYNQTTVTKEEEFDLPYDLDNLNANEYEGTSKKVYDTFLGQVKDKQEVKELQDLQNRLDTVEQNIYENNETYSTLTSKDFQTNLKRTSKLRTRLEEFEANPNWVERRTRGFTGKKKPEVYSDEYYNAVDQMIDESNVNDVTKQVLKNKFALDQIVRKHKRKADVEKVVDNSMKNYDNTVNKTPDNTPPSAADKKIEAVALKVKNGQKLSKEDQTLKDQFPDQVKAKVRELQGIKSKAPTDSTKSEKLYSEGKELANVIKEDNLFEEETPKKPEVVIEHTPIGKLISTIETSFKSFNKLKFSAIAKASGLTKAEVKSLVNQLVKDGRLNEENGKYTLVDTNAVPDSVQKHLSNFTTVNAVGKETAPTLTLKESQYGKGLSDEEFAVVQKQIDNDLDWFRNNGYSVSVRSGVTTVVDKNSTNSTTKGEEQIESLEPKELKESISEESKEKIRTIVENYIETMKDLEGGKMPSFEQFLLSYIQNVGKTEADNNFNGLVKGWEWNGYPKEEFKKVYARIFRPLSEQSLSLSSAINEVYSTDEEIREYNNEDRPGETEESKVVDVDPDNNVVVEYFTLTSENDAPKFGYSSRRATQTLTQEGDNIVQVDYTYDSLELNEDSMVKHQKLLDPDKYNPGDELEIVVLDEDQMNAVTVPVYNEDPTSLKRGSKIGTELYGDFLARKEAENPNFKDTQEYIDTLPLFIKDSEGDLVAMVHEPRWYNTFKFNGDIDAAKKNTRTIRRNAVNALRAGKKANIKITNKSGGSIVRIPDSEPLVLIKEANPEAEIGLVSKGKIMINGEPFVGELINDAKNFYDDYKGRPVEIRRWGTNKNGEPTYRAFPIILPLVNNEQVTTMEMLIRTFLLKGVDDSYKKLDYHLIDNVLNDLRPGYGKGLDQLLKQFIRVEAMSYSKGELDPVKVGESMYKSKVDKDGNLRTSEPLPYYFSQDGHLVFGIGDGSPAIILHPSDFEGDAKEGMAKLEKVVTEILPDFKLNYHNNYNNQPVIHIDSDLNVKQQAPPGEYSSYVREYAMNNIKSFNIGTEQNPNWITRIQPSFYFESSEPTNRKVEPSRTEVTEEKKQKVNTIVETTNDQDLEDAVIVAETVGDFVFEGDTLEEKVEDAKEMLKEDTSESTDFVEEHLEAKVGEEVQEEDYHKLIKQAEAQVKWVEEYFEGDESLDPREIKEEDVREIVEEVFKIPGLSAKHQGELIDFIYNKVSNEVSFDSGSAVSKDKLVEELNKGLEEMLITNEQVLKEFLDKLNDLPEDKKVASLKNKYNKALEKIQLVKDNKAIIVEEGIAKVFKYTGITEGTMQEIDEENEDTDAIEDTSTERETNYSKTSLEDNGKDSMTYRLKRFMSGIENTNPRTGKVNRGAMGVPLYVPFDVVVDTVRGFLADAPVDFEAMIGILESHEKAHGWIPTLVQKLKAQDNEMKNAFTSNMASHALKMEFVMYSFDQKNNRMSLKVMNTNSSAVQRKLSDNWKNTLLNDSPLVKVVDGEYQTDIDVAKELYDEYNSWYPAEQMSGNSQDKRNVSNLIKKAIGQNKKAIPLPKGKQFEKIAKNLSETRELQVGKEFFKVKVINDVLHFSEADELPPVGKALLNYNSMTNDKKQEAISDLKEWFRYFGVSLSDNVIDKIFRDKIYVGRGEALNSQQFFKKSSETAGTVGLFADWLSGIVNEQYSLDVSNTDIKNANPLRNSSVEKVLSKLQSRFEPAIVTNSFRDGKKSIYGFTAFKYITDRMKDLQQGEVGKNGLISNDMIEKLKSLSYSQNSVWLDFLQNPALNDSFQISHLGLTAIKEMGKKVYQDNGITKLSDADHELVKLGMFMDLKQGSSRETYGKGKEAIGLRTAKFLFPTMSDKSTMTVVQTQAFDFFNKNFYKTNTAGDVVVTSQVEQLLFDQLVEPELSRIVNFTQVVGSTDIKNYDKGATKFLMLPQLNNVVIEVDGIEIKLSEYLNSGRPYTKAKVQELFGTAIKEELQNYVRALVEEKMNVWERNGYLTVDEKGNQKSFFDASYMNREGIGKLDPVKGAAYDFVMNSLIANSNAFQTIIGDPAIYYKSKAKDALTQSKDTFVNVGKRLAAMIAPGSKLADSQNETYTQIFLDDRVSLSENLPFLTKLLDNKAFDADRWAEIQNMKPDGDTEIEIKQSQDAIDVAKKEFLSQYPNSLDYFFIEGTDAQEYTTWKEHLHILEKMGRTPDVVATITPQEIREAKKMFASGVPIDKMSDKQKAVLKKVMQPIKPVYTGQLYDADQDVMRMMYIKTSSFPLIPQLTKGLEIDKLRNAMQKLEKESGSFVRASYQSGNKVGLKNNPLSFFDKEGRVVDLTSEMLTESSLTLNRKDFKIQLDVPYKSYKKDQDTVSMGTQLTKLLFGNGIMELPDGSFTFDGKPISGRALEEKYTESFVRLSKLRKASLMKELGINPNTLKPYSVKDTAKKLQKLLKDEANSRGYSKQDVEGLELEYVKDSAGRIVDYKFKMPLWMSANSNRFESLLNAIVTNRLVKFKFPGASYVAGSEEGFKFQADLKGIDDNKIVWTDKWEGKLRAARFDNDGKFIQAQVIAPSKFRNENGELIDLLSTDKDGKYKYVIKTESGFKLREDKIDSELLSITSFRVPTSGHVSASQLEIVGFLPQESGDLMIVPKNLTVQKGLDFDVDKETTYNLWSKVDENGKLVALKETEGMTKDILEEEIETSYTELLELEGDEAKELTLAIKEMEKTLERLLMNDIIKIHKSVLTSPDARVQKKINSVLSMDFTKKQSELIDGLLTSNKDETYFTPLSDEYQKQKMFLGAAGKVGIGAYSLDVTSHSLFEQAKAKGNELSLLGDEDNPFRISFGSPRLTSRGELGKSNTLDGKRSIADVLAERQNIATDNEKEQVMGKVNINGLTLDVDKVLCMLGFDRGEDGNSIAFSFLSQPIILEYVQKMSNAGSNIAEYSPDKEQKVIDELYEKYATDLKERGWDLDANYGYQMSTEKMLAQIENGGQDGNFQAAILNRFLLLKGYGESIRSVQSAINTDSKGLGKSIAETGEKIDAVVRLFSNDKIENAGKLLGDVKYASEMNLEEINQAIADGFEQLGNSGIYISPTTSNGIFTLNTLNTAALLWDKHFPYSSSVATKIFDELLPLIAGEEASASKKVERKQLIFKEMKKYLNAYASQQLITGNVQAERERLFFDRGENQSLSSYLQEQIKNHPILKNNKLLQRFEFKQDKADENTPSTIFFNNTAQGNFDEDYLNTAILELMERDIPLSKFNGEMYTTRKLAQDLVSYSLLEGGVQEAVQFSKFVPLRYLEKMGFVHAVGQVDFNQDFSVFGIHPEAKAPSSFALQFAQHNPMLMPKVDTLDVIKKSGVYERNEKGDNVEVKVREKNVKEAPVEFKVTEDSITPAFTSQRVKGESYLWRYVGDNTYRMIPTKNTFGMSDYVTGKVQPTKSLTSSITPDPKPIVEAKPSDSKVFSDTTQAARFALQDNNIVRTVSAISDGGFGYISDLAKKLLKATDGNVQVVVKDIKSRGSYNLSTNTITIDKNWAETATAQELATTVMKEVVHSISDKELLKYTNDEGSLQSSNTPQHIRTIISLFNKLRKDPKFNSKLKEMKAQIKATGGLTKDNKRIYYGAYNIREFVEMMMTQPEFQAEMAKIKVGNQSVLDKFKQFLNQLFKSLGLKFESDTIAAQTIDAVLEMVDIKAGEAESRIVNETKIIKIEPTVISTVYQGVEYDVEYSANLNTDTLEYSNLKFLNITYKGVGVSEELEKNVIRQFNKDEKDSQNPSLELNLAKLMNETLTNDETELVVPNVSDFLGYPELTKLMSEEDLEVGKKEYEYMKEHPAAIEDILIEVEPTSMYDFYEKTTSYYKDEISKESIVNKKPQEETETVEDLIRQVEAKPEMKKYELFPGVYANKEQTEAIDKMLDFLDSDAEYFVLEGRGGTGKTTIIKKVISMSGERNVVGATIAHQARKILQKSLGDSFRTSTLAAMLGKTEIEGKWRDNPKFNPKFSPLSSAKIVIIDETSMISDQQLADIERFKKEYNPKLKIVFMGDNVQLPPIGQVEESATFKTAKEEHKARLIERMRQGEESPILPITDILAANVESEKPVLKAITNRKDNFDPTTNEGVLFGTEQEMTGEMEKDFVNEPYETKAIVYKNNTKENVNNKVRELRFGEAAKYPINVGDVLVSHDNKPKEDVFNGEYYIVLEAKPVSNAVYVSEFVDGKLISVPFPGYRVTVKNEEGKIINHTIPNPDLAAKGGRIQQMQQSYADAISSGKLPWKQWPTYYREKENYVVSLEYGYAVTSHKAQGSTFNNVYVFEQDILSIAKANNKAKNQSLYVATSRPRKKLVMISNDAKVDTKMEVLQEEKVPVGTEGDMIVSGLDPKEIEETTSEEITKGFRNNTGVSKRLSYKKALSLAKEYNQNKNLYVAKVIEVMGEKGDTRIYNAVKLYPREIESQVLIPKYQIDKTLSNRDGSKRFAQTNGTTITLNPVNTIKEFFDYFEGKEGGITSQQKALVLEEMERKGYPLSKIKSLLSSKKLINTFLILHEQSHIASKDKDVYWKQGRDMLTSDKIEIEARASIEALQAIEGSQNTIPVKNVIVKNQINNLIRKGLIKAKCK